MVIAVLFQLDNRDPPFDPPDGRFHGLRALQVERRRCESLHILETRRPRNADQLRHRSFHYAGAEILAVDDVPTHEIAIVILPGLDLPTLRPRGRHHLRHGCERGSHRSLYAGVNATGILDLLRNCGADGVELVHVGDRTRASTASSTNPPSSVNATTIVSATGCCCTATSGRCVTAASDRCAGDVRRAAEDHEAGSRILVAVILLAEQGVACSGEEFAIRKQRPCRKEVAPLARPVL